MKYFIILILISLCVVWADDPQTPEVPQVPEAPKMDPTAQAFLDKVTTFANSYLTTQEQLAAFKVTFLTEVGNMAKDVQSTETFDAAEYFQPNQYVDGVAQKVATTLNTADFKNTQFSDIRRDYILQVADFCMKEYMRDMKEGITQVPTTAYLGDVDNVTNSKTEQIADRKNPPQSVKLYYDPKKSLDTVYGITGRPVATVIWGGVNDNVTTSNLIALLDRIQNRYYSSSTYSSMDFNELKKDFPQGTALDVMRNSSDKNIYNTKASVGQSYEVDQYGKIINQFTNTGSTSEQVFPPANDGTYNNRSYGYRYSNGTHTTFKLSMNGREYTMQETVFTSPIVLDLNGDGILEASKGQHMPHDYSGSSVVEFDMDGDGFLDLTEWVGANDGILLSYKTGDDVNANNLFGTAGGFYHGYEKLSLLDKNKDGKISGEELSTLSVWQDKNVDGIVDSGEITSVQKLGITSISLNHSADFVSSFEQNGTTKKMWDWFPNIFRVKRTR